MPQSNPVAGENVEFGGGHPLDHDVRGKGCVSVYATCAEVALVWSRQLHQLSWNDCLSKCQADTDRHSSEQRQQL